VTVTGRLVDLESEEPVPGMLVYTKPLDGDDQQSMTALFDRSDARPVSGADGRFTIAGAPAGRVYITVFPEDFVEGSDYDFALVAHTIPPRGPHDVGDVKLVRRRVPMRERGGDLGFELEQQAPTTDPEDVVLEVVLVRPEGPAAAAGLHVNDVIVSVDGHDVRAKNHYLFQGLTRVPVGTTVKLGLARDAEVAITAVKPQ
jgi:hypothetical protein